MLNDGDADDAEDVSIISLSSHLMMLMMRMMLMMPMMLMMQNDAAMACMIDRYRHRSKVTGCHGQQEQFDEQKEYKMYRGTRRRSDVMPTENAAEKQNLYVMMVMMMAMSV